MRRRHLMAVMATTAAGLLAAPGLGQSAVSQTAGDSSAKERMSSDGTAREHPARGAGQSFIQHEQRHRMWQARLNRLREIATEQGDETRLARLDQIEKRITVVRERTQAKARERLGDERFEQLSEQMRQRDARRTVARRHGQLRGDRREDVRDVREDARDVREDARDVREDARDLREDVRDRREDMRDRREDVRDKREDVADRREDVRDGREDVRDRRDDKVDRRPQRTQGGSPVSPSTSSRNKRRGARR